MHPGLGNGQEQAPLLLRDPRTPALRRALALCRCWGLAAADLLHVPSQTLYNKTAEALDQMLQSFIIQNPTTDELHFLLSVRAGSHTAGSGRPRRGRGRTKEDVPKEAGPEPGVGSGSGTWRLQTWPSSGIAVSRGSWRVLTAGAMVVRGP